ncbi:MAG: elongation factor Ts [Nevskia sp.]|nr:elongation factor Ts [Nevskia sp.]
MSTPITAALVKELRERTGAGMSDCKKALEATAGDIDAAAEKLRMDGAAKADKKAGRTAAEGMVAIAANDQAVAVVELNSETDFVAKNADFRALANTVAQAALASRPASLEALLALKAGGDKTLDELRREAVAKIGEKIDIRRFEVIPSHGGPVATYIHPGDKIAVVVAMKQGEHELAKDLAMHIAAMAPKHLDASAVPAEAVESERKIIEAQVAQEQADEAARAAEEGRQHKPKPAEIVAKMVEGKVRKFLSEITLHGQAFVKDADQTVEKLLKAKNAAVGQFTRVMVGEGIEKKKTDFAAEVMEQAGLKKDEPKKDGDAPATV